ncbi:uncharacterized protein MONOS_15834 [Monocercomonoides exilis]|uniref:uncharacterized protein n=1 Tax=Monocercomonoides exilis TaxID=2049356 RepID=UPI00355A19D9|nr:hypothetical protein MONOS_15834 [Monocercomonoides exilis]|eukprot:MONOS_15834.1-p1 / transcript=MONOS_15834.1 / gene=MONOS_15834 / organism=Monocercomonoides_exilis_PA203 / gene_product=unspecified product / transcript_product=unspecified product / location=Mono_scaffold01372:2932-4829(+) / protein_length=467 / sequence_SO=supercontig / SO=protein_coding / is_pseudo=false
MPTPQSQPPSPSPIPLSPHSFSSSTSSSSSSIYPSSSHAPPPGDDDSPSSFTPSKQSNSHNSPSAFLSSLSAHKSLSVHAAASPLRKSVDSYSESRLQPIPPTPSDRIEGIDGAVAFDYQYEKITTLATLSAEDGHCGADRTSYSSSSSFKTSLSHAYKPIRAPTFSSHQIQNLCGISNSSQNTGAYAAASDTTALPLSVLSSSPTICQSALFPLLSPLTKEIELLVTPIISFASQQKESRAGKTAKQHGMNATNSSQLPSQLLSSAGWILSGDRIRKISEADSAAPSSLMSTMMDEGFITSCPQNVFNMLVDTVNPILSPLAFYKAMTSLAQKRLAGKSSALGYPQSASSSSSLPPTSIERCNSHQTNKNQTGSNNSSSEMSINPFSDPSNDIIVPSEQQRQLQGTVGGFLFVADKNRINGFRKAAVVSTQRKMFIEQMTVNVDYANRRTHSSSLPLSSLTLHKE